MHLITSYLFSFQKSDGLWTSRLCEIRYSTTLTSLIHTLRMFLSFYFWNLVRFTKKSSVKVDFRKIYFKNSEGSNSRSFALVQFCAGAFTARPFQKKVFFDFMFLRVHWFGFLVFGEWSVFGCYIFWNYMETAYLLYILF
jgi:hypothetical protein